MHFEYYYCITFIKRKMVTILRYIKYLVGSHTDSCLQISHVVFDNLYMTVQVSAQSLYFRLLTDIWSCVIDVLNEGIEAIDYAC